MSKIQQGLKPKDRKLATTSTAVANQWQNTPQQNLFMKLWLDSNNGETFGNQYQAALKAGYSESYSHRIASRDTGNKWISMYLNRSIYGKAHIQQTIQKIIQSVPNSKSPDDTRLKGLELLARINGIMDNKNTTNVTIVQPILSGMSINTPTPEPPIEATVVDTP